MIEVVVGALLRDGRVLLGHRSPTKHANPDSWDLPGGVVEAGESQRAALARELGEELGVRIAPDTAELLCRVTVGPPEEPAVLSAWLVPDWNGEPANLAPEEHDDIGWFSIAELPPFAHSLVHTSLTDAMERQRA